MSDRAFYCTKCGNSTDWPSEHLRGFDPDFGYHRYRYRTVCPNRRHMFDGHHRSGWTYSTHSPEGCEEDA